MLSSHASDFKEKALQWANCFEVCCCLNSNAYVDTYGSVEFLIAAGAKHQISIKAGNGFETLKNFYDTHQTYIFGFLGYDLKNEIENLNSNNDDKLLFDDLFFFVPEHLIRIRNHEVTVLMGDENILKIIENQQLDLVNQKNDLNIQSKISKKEYLQTVKKLQQHIFIGDIYEVNFCQEFFAQQALINPLRIYEQLNALSPAPFSCYFKIKHQYILSSSPERFLCKRGHHLVSQPMKGTAKTNSDTNKDEQAKSELKNNEKERAENIMIVDLVRNDLSKSALSGTVTVNELCEIYSFAQVHQMISTVSCELDTNIHFVDAIKNTFPMGSMTGAPKLKAMQLIEQYESSKRGVYSGSLGYISPNGDFDFNVIIRSVLYNMKKKYLSFHVGSAITATAEGEKEYEECLIKASAMLKILQN